MKRYDKMVLIRILLLLGLILYFKSTASSQGRPRRVFTTQGMHVGTLTKENMDRFLMYCKIDSITGIVDMLDKSELFDIRPDMEVNLVDIKDNYLVHVKVKKWEIYFWTFGNELKKKPVHMYSDKKKDELQGDKIVGG